MPDKDRSNEVTIRLSDEEVRALQQRAELEDLSAAELARLAVVNSLAPNSAETLRNVTRSVLGVEIFVLPSRS